MSHFSTLRTKITDVEVLKETLQSLGLQVKTDATIKAYNNVVAKVDVAACLEGGYDIGWQLAEDGSYSLIADLWGVAQKHNQQELINSINQKYAVQKALCDAKVRMPNANVRVQVAATV